MKNNFNKTFSFKTQMGIGDLGEKDFLKYYAALGPKKSVDDLTTDFILGNGKRVELKSESRTLEETENFFIELYSDVDASKIGGPCKARQDNVNYFIYYFPKNKTFFWFNTIELCDKFNNLALSGKWQIKTIRNRGYYTNGFAMPRIEFNDILMKKDTF